jgi:calcineurin-like phosphoesterase family protein
MPNVWFSSDHHFGHANILSYCNHRPWSTAEEMNEGLISRWNERVAPKDTVYHLGDFTLTKDIDQVDSWLGRLNGTIRLVRGNHDNWVRKADQLKNRHKLKWIEHYAERKFHVDGTTHKVVMCHFPMLFWHGSHYGAFHIHGHSHGHAQKYNEGLRRYDVGVDCNNWYPVLMEKVIRQLADLPLNPHHDRD